MRILLTLMATVFLSISCVSNMGMPHGFGPAGVLYTDTQTGLSGGEMRPNMQEGRACTMQVLSIIGIGDASVDDAARAGGITNISAVEKHVWGIVYIPVFARLCTVVYGT